MARIRSLHPEFWSDKRMVRLSPYARLFYMGMWTFSLCHQGHLDDDAEELKLKILPADQIDAEELLGELIEAGRVQRCARDDGGTYLWVPKLAEHQKIDPRWTSRCPYCAGQRASPNNHTETHPSTAEHSRATPSHPGAHPNSPEHTQTPLRKGRDGKGSKTSSSPAAPATEKDPDFVRFWTIYPRKVGKPTARQAWTKAIKAGAEPATIHTAARRYADERAGQDPTFTAHPGTWLNAERWNDPAPNPAISTAHVPFWDA